MMKGKVRCGAYLLDFSVLGSRAETVSYTHLDLAGTSEKRESQLSKALLCFDVMFVLSVLCNTDSQVGEFIYFLDDFPVQKKQRSHIIGIP